MNPVAWIVAAVLLTGAAGVAAWPARGIMHRLHDQPRFALPTVDILPRLRDFADRRPRQAVGVAALSGAGSGLVIAGPVAGFVFAAYGALGARAWVRRALRRRAAATRSRSLDELNALAADLRAGLAIDTGGLASNPGAAPGDARLTELTAAVWRLAEQTGAPAADLVERIEADGRASDRAKATAAAEAAGAQATALLLAALPLGGIALGYGIGVDPLQVLLRTPLGAACAAGAVVLQSAGLLWADRLANGPAHA